MLYRRSRRLGEKRSPAEGPYYKMKSTKVRETRCGQRHVGAAATTTCARWAKSKAAKNCPRIAAAGCARPLQSSERDNGLRNTCIHAGSNAATERNGAREPNSGKGDLHTFWNPKPRQTTTHDASLPRHPHKTTGGKTNESSYRERNDPWASPRWAARDCSTVRPLLAHENAHTHVIRGHGVSKRVGSATNKYLPRTKNGGRIPGGRR